MDGIKISGDKRLLVLGVTVMWLLLGLMTGCFVSVATGAIKTASPADRVGILWMIVGLCVAWIGTCCLCMKTWRVDYFFTEDRIMIARGFQRQGMAYEARTYCTIECVMDSSLSFGTKDPNSYYLVMSRQRIPGLEKMNIGAVRQEKDRVIIQLSKKNRETLRQVADLYPRATYTPGIRRVLSKASI